MSWYLREALRKSLQAPIRTLPVMLFFDGKSGSSMATSYAGSRYFDPLRAQARAMTLTSLRGYRGRPALPLLAIAFGQASASDAHAKAARREGRRDVEVMGSLRLALFVASQISC